jgi:hypothetical protein
MALKEKNMFQLLFPSFSARLTSGGRIMNYKYLNISSRVSLPDNNNSLMRKNLKWTQIMIRKDNKK